MKTAFLKVISSQFTVKGSALAGAFFYWKKYRRWIPCHFIEIDINGTR